MSKITITESSVDSFRKSLGKAKVVETYNNGEARINNNGNKEFNIFFEESGLVDTGMLYEENSTIRIESPNLSSASSFRRRLNEVLPLGSIITDHYVSIDNHDRVYAVEKDHINKTITSFNIENTFNYLSLQYDLDSRFVNELFFPSIMDKKLKTDFLDYKRNRKASPLYSSDRSAMRKVVVPNFGKDRMVALNCSDVKSNYPYYNEIQIVDKVSNKFTNFLEKTDMFDLFLSDYLQSQKRAISMNIQNGKQVLQNTDVMIYNAANLSFTDGMSVFPGLQLLDDSITDKSKMMIDYKKMLFAGYIKMLSKKGFRTFKDLYYDVECYKENIIYSVEKFKDEAVGSPLQEFFIPVVNDLTRYADTQIKYGQTYVYKCKSHCLIVGNRYQYDNLRFFNPSPESFYAKVDIKNTPTIVVVPFDIFSDISRVIQPPPIFPQVKFVSENNAKSRVDVYLTPTKGEIRDKFIKVKPEDQSQIEDMQKNYGSVSFEGDQILFKYFEEQGNYEIYRMSSPPQSYEDFRDMKVADVTMSFNTSDAIFRNCLTANSEHNYFMFRKINAKGLVSNPSPIYKVKLLIDADDSRLFVSEYKFPKKITSQPSKKFKRLFQIAPAIEQTMYDPDQEPVYQKRSLKGMVKEIKLGWAGESVWGKKFKFRIKSTSSGKIIDYNIRFKLTKNKTEADFN